MEHELNRAIPTSLSHSSGHPDETRHTQPSALYPILKLLWPSLPPLFPRPGYRIFTLLLRACNIPLPHSS